MAHAGDVTAQDQFVDYDDLCDIAGAIAVQLEHGGQWAHADAIRFRQERYAAWQAHEQAEVTARRLRG